MRKGWIEEEEERREKRQRSTSRESETGREGNTIVYARTWEGVSTGTLAILETSSYNSISPTNS